MNILIIGKPKINVRMVLDGFPKENSKTTIFEKQEEIGGTSVYIAKMLTNWGVPVYYAGATCGDELGLKIKSDLEASHIDTKYLETDYEHHTNMNYILLNKASGTSTEVYVDEKSYLTKHKYDNPDYIITDGTDLGASIAAANNYPNAKIILLANKVNNEYYDLSKRSHYVVASASFASALTKIPMDYKPKTLVNIFQKIKDLNKANFIVMLNEHGVLYAKERDVKMLPALKVEKQDDSNSGAAFFGAYIYGLINNMDIDDTAKIANIAGGIALTKIGMDSIPLKSEVFRLAGIDESKVKSPEAKETPKAPIEPTENQKEEVKEGTTNA